MLWACEKGSISIRECATPSTHTHTYIPGAIKRARFAAIYTRIILYTTLPRDFTGARITPSSTYLLYHPNTHTHTYTLYSQVWAKSKVKRNVNSNNDPKLGLAGEFYMYLLLALIYRRAYYISVMYYTIALETFT